MSTPRLFCPETELQAGRIVLPESAAHHAVRVLRIREGDPLTLFDGRGGEYPGRLIGIERRSAVAELGEHLPVERESRLPITLVQALQAGERMDVTIQKAVELGVALIVPVEARRSVVRLDAARAAKRLAHWRQVVASACEQCGRNRVLEIREVEPLDQWLARPSAGATRLMLSPMATRSLADLAAPAAIELLVGPEGGLSVDEALAAESVGYLPLRLGPRVLRTETAGMAALAAMHARWGDFV